MNFSSRSPSDILRRMNIRPGTVFLAIMLVALAAFEAFNYSTTDYALNDLLGSQKFWGISWSTILAIAFCGIDFAGIARLFTPEQGASEPKEVWYLLGAWALAATMNAILTWWGVAMAIATHPVRSTAVIDSTMLTQIVPVFVALMVWLIRVLIIGTLSVTGDRLLHGEHRAYSTNRGRTTTTTSVPAAAPAMTTAQAMAARPSLARAAAAARPAPVAESRPERTATEPTYQNFNAVAMNARQAVRAAPIGEPPTAGERRH
jgi:hypothetical protein